VPGLLRVVVDDLEEVVLGVLEDHEDALVLEDDFDELDDVGVTELRAEGHLPHRRLRDAGIGDLLALLVGLELFDGKLARLALPTAGLVDTAIGTATDETNDIVLVRDMDFALVPDGSMAAVCGICGGEEGRILARAGTGR
jgi:hypothetical protein